MFGLFLVCDDNAGVYVQIGTTLTSTDSSYTLLKKGLDYGTTDNYEITTLDNVPCLSTAVTGDNYIGFSPDSGFISGVGRDNPVIGVIRYYDDTGGGTSDGNLRFTFRYDSLFDSGTWAWLGSFDEDGDGLFTSTVEDDDGSGVETAPEVYKLDTDTWKTWCFMFPAPEFQNDIGVGITGAKFFIHNRSDGPDAFSFLSLVKLNDATFKTVAQSSDFSAWNVIQDSNVAPSISYDSVEQALKIDYSFDDATGDGENEWFDVGPSSPILIGGEEEKIPAFDRNAVLIVVKVKFADSSSPYSLNSPSTLRLIIQDAGGEVFIISRHRVTVSNQTEYAWFSLTGKIGAFHIWEDTGLEGGSVVDNNIIDFPIYFYAIRVDDEPDTFDESGTLYIYEIKVRTDETPPFTPQLVEPADKTVFSETQPVVLKWNPTEDMYSGVASYTVEVSSDESFSDIVYSKTYEGQYFSQLEASLGRMDVGTYYWRVKVEDRLGNRCYSDVWSFSVASSEEEALQETSGVQVKIVPFPNPCSFASGDKLVFKPSAGKVKSVMVYDITGKKVWKGGAVWNGKNLKGMEIKCGVYIAYVTVELPDGTETKVGPVKLVVRR